MTKSNNKISLIALSRHTCFVCGLPSFDSYYVAYIASEVFRHVYGDTSTIAVNNINDDTLERCAIGSPNQVLFADLPDIDASRSICNSHAPLLFVVEDFAAATQRFMQTRACTGRDAAVTVTRCYSALEDIRTHPRAVHLAIDKFDSALALMSFVADAIGVPTEMWTQVYPVLLENPLLHQHPVAASEEFSRAAVQSGIHLDHDEQKIIADLARSFNIAADEPFSGTHVPLALMLNANRTPHYLPAALDLTGPARCLTFGPYISIPKGQWKARLEFRTDNNQSGNELTFDITEQSSIVAEGFISLRQSGRFSLSIPFDVKESSHTLEFRTHLKEGAIEGRLEILDLELTRRS